MEAVRDGGRVRHDVVARLGEASSLRASGELDRIVAALASHAQRSWCDESGIDVEEARSAGAVAAVATYWGRLGLDRHFAAMAGSHDAPIADAVLAMEADLRGEAVPDPDIGDQVISPSRALRELGRIRRVTMTRRRAHHRARHPPQRPPGPDPRRRRRRGGQLGTRFRRLSRSSVQIKGM